MIARTVFNKLVKGYRIASKREEVGPTIIQKPSKVVQIYPQIPFIERPIEKPKKAKKKEIEVKVEGIEIPVFSPRAVRISKMKPEEEKIERMTYPLIPSKPKKGEPIFAYADISWDSVSHKHVYNLIEPKLSPELGDILNKIKDPEEALFYARKVIENNWSRDMLAHQIESKLYKRQGKALSNFHRVTE